MPVEIKHFISACGEEPVAVVDGDSNLFEVFEIGQILDKNSDAFEKNISNKMITLACCYKNQSLVYRFDKRTWCIYIPLSDNYISEQNTLEELMSEVYGVKFTDNNNDLQNKVTETLQDLTLPKGAFKMMNVYEAAEDGDAFAQNEVALRYHEGYTVEQSDEKAFEWWKKAAAQDFPAALYGVGNCYQNGWGVEEDMGKAVEYWMKAAEKGHDVSQYFIGSCYYNGIVLEVDQEKAFEWWRKAAEQGVPEAELNMGVFCVNGRFVPQNFEEAFNWFKRAAEHGHCDASYELGVWYYKGKCGVEKDLHMAVKYFKEALELGSEQAQEALDEVMEKLKGE